MTIGSKLHIETMSDELHGHTEPGINQNMIKKTYEIIREMTEIQKFSKARAHIFDALKYKHPRH